ncbi:hypothetical protein KIPB_005333 [Kipferlia bialata]|uniref:Guanylate cyclase domain-containing protein n=1 Tax=Kipferlia bialata TaxID=797122 RepID=A0A9K3CVW2_9EUKA|nr:hypothetical protein KIPB_005333 [Kipferlia bialata]|eukprot:g5333.t1
MIRRLYAVSLRSAFELCFSVTILVLLLISSSLIVSIVSDLVRDDIRNTAAVAAASAVGILGERLVSSLSRQDPFTDPFIHSYAHSDIHPIGAHPISSGSCDKTQHRSPHQATGYLWLDGDGYAYESDDTSTKYLKLEEEAWLHKVLCQSYSAGTDMYTDLDGGPLSHPVLSGLLVHHSVALPAGQAPLPLSPLSPLSMYGSVTDTPSDILVLSVPFPPDNWGVSDAGLPLPLMGWDRAPATCPPVTVVRRLRVASALQGVSSALASCPTGQAALARVGVGMPCPLHNWASLLSADVSTVYVDSDMGNNADTSMGGTGGTAYAASDSSLSLSTVTSLGNGALSLTLQMVYSQYTHRALKLYVPITLSLSYACGMLLVLQFGARVIAPLQHSIGSLADPLSMPVSVSPRDRQGQGEDTSTSGDTGTKSARASRTHSVPPPPLIDLSEYGLVLSAAERLNRTNTFFSLFVPESVQTDIARGEQVVRKMGRTNACLLFVDVDGFTSLCETEPPGVISSFMEIFFEACSTIISRYGGYIDKFIGDCIMAVWPTEQVFELSASAEKVCRAAIAIQTSVADVSRDIERQGFRHKISCKIGINAGPVLIGYIGSASRFSYTLVGDTVNLAARLEGLNHQFGTRILATEAFASLLGPDFLTRALGPYPVKGKNDPVSLSEIIGLTDDMSPQELEVVSLHNLAWAAIRGGNLGTAAALSHSALDAARRLSAGHGQTEGYGGYDRYRDPGHRKGHEGEDRAAGQILSVQPTILLNEQISNVIEHPLFQVNQPTEGYSLATLLDGGGLPVEGTGYGALDRQGDDSEDVSVVWKQTGKDGEISDLLNSLRVMQ